MPDSGVMVTTKLSLGSRSVSCATGIVIITDDCPAGIVPVIFTGNAAPSKSFA
ncbi:hypothetical protein D3C72_967130 [compost metagenome]